MKLVLNLMKWLIGIILVLAVIMTAIVVIIIKTDDRESDNANYAETHPHFIIEGQKPEDAEMTAYVKYFGEGKSCPGWAWSASSGKKTTGIYNERFKFTKNLSKSKSYYQFKLPYTNREPEPGCVTHITQVTLFAHNSISSSFAHLVLYPFNKKFDRKASDESVGIQAIRCNGIKFKDEKQYIGIRCDYYMKHQKLSKTYNDGPTVNYDFSRFTSSTVIHYDILKGEKYPE